MTRDVCEMIPDDSHVLLFLPGVLLPYVFGQTGKLVGEPQEPFPQRRELCR